MENKLEVWKLAHELTMDVYKVADMLPKKEQYNLTAQMKRSAASVPTNIVEGQARQYRKEFRQFLFIAKASNAETRYHLFLSKELGYISQEAYDLLSKKSERVMMMLSRLIAALGVGR
jgi:four helix bundle protein